ncbi:serine/threonine protein kinase [Corallococcus coralloides DSM 2259]|uniref:Serine/threonine protein kinase n=1 Tax=Corallococcus coralloides (strain ATCC 25202 / DSM 2259 / NBRC 100086 / M2) TaxID=1144275 RepID=H8N0N4_CORCM|nr:serine/threonine-protein kinase [Corallococcus coralloides]AFE09880.1 serine/threonine protein kinase [Corallococcus coralloides DSM 2259]
MQLGKYQLVRKLASGGMAEVFLAKAAGPRGFEKTLVLKRILPHLAEDEAFVEMFLGEAQLAARLDHPNVVQIFDFGEVDGSYFLAMEYIDGPTLRRLIKRSAELKQPLPPGVCAKMVAAAAEGLAFAHELADPETGAPLGLVHRDISPENVLVSRQGAVKVVDFGIAKVAGQSHRTATGVVKGKVAYMPPEQLQARPMDGRVDVYALGIVLYELLTGKRPFDATTDVSMMQAILFEPFVPAVQRRPDLPESMQRILEKALAKDREQRYPDCRAFQADLERFVLSLGEPVGAYQISRLVAQVMEGVEATPVSPTPAKGRVTAPVALVPESATTPMPARVGTAWEPLASRGSMAAPAVTASQHDIPSSRFDAATDPATPSAGSLLRNSSRAQPQEEVSKVAASEEPVLAGAVRSPRRKLVGAMVAVSVLGLAGGLAVAGRGEKAAAPASAPAPVARTDDAPVKPPEPKVTPVVPEARVEPVATETVDSGTPAVVAEVKPATENSTEVRDAGVVTEVAPTPRPTVAVKPATTSPVTPPVRRVATPVRRELPKGKVEFRVRPFGTVYLDGKNLGQTPFAAVEATEGSHQVRVVNKDLGKDVTRAFEVKAGQDNVFKLNLAAE